MLEIGSERYPTSVHLYRGVKRRLQLSCRRRRLGRLRSSAPSGHLEVNDRAARWAPPRAWPSGPHRVTSPQPEAASAEAEAAQFCQAREAWTAWS